MKVNNNQKMREVLEKVDSELKSYCSENETLDDRFYNDPPDYTCIRDSLLDINRLVKAALAAPPRNCDIGSADEQHKRFKKQCIRHYDVHGNCFGCPCLKMSGGCEFHWAQMPYEEGEAK